MATIATNSSIWKDLDGKTVIVTGGANGIGLEVVRTCHDYGANVVIGDLPCARETVTKAIRDLDESSRMLYVAMDVTQWVDLTSLFKAAIDKFGRVDIVVANAGIMESQRFFDFEVDEWGELKEQAISGKVIDVNLKGCMNTLRLATFYMAKNTRDANGWRGSIVLVSSTSGYIGGTGVVSYVSSKHGVTGLLRASHGAALTYGIRVNAVAPFITPTYITGGYVDLWKAKGLPLNTPSDVVSGIVRTALDQRAQGKSYLVAGGGYREIEGPMESTLASWAGQGTAELFAKAGAFFDNIGGYPLPGVRSHIATENAEEKYFDVSRRV